MKPLGRYPTYLVLAQTARSRQMTDTAIAAEGIGKRFGPVTALDGVDLVLPAGGVLGLLGPNGAGKTTMVRILATLLRPDRGRAQVAGFDVAGQPREVRRRIGLSGQYAAADPFLTGEENLVLIGRLYGLSSRRARRRAADLAGQLGLDGAARRLVRTYSGGMRRRLDLAASLVAAPPVLFLDEPTTGLDPASRLTVWEEVRRINTRGTTVFLTTQYLEEADQLCDRLAIIDGGVIVREGTPAALKAELRLRRNLSSDPSLDDVFLDATGRTREHVAGDVQEVKA
jgi:ABC-2 type transport system ATP-binding protein